MTGHTSVSSQYTTRTLNCILLRRGYFKSPLPYIYHKSFSLETLNRVPRVLLQFLHSRISALGDFKRHSEPPFQPNLDVPEFKTKIRSSSIFRAPSQTEGVYYYKKKKLKIKKNGNFKRKGVSTWGLQPRISEAGSVSIILAGGA